LTFIGKTINDVSDDNASVADKIQASKILGMVATKMYFQQREVYQVVDAVLTQEELTNYGISQSDINDNKLNADASHITLDLAEQLVPYVGTPTTLGFLAANVTDKYPRGVPSTETSKKMAWKVALEFFIQNKEKLMPPLYKVPEEL
jgi:hypothetical protein